MIAFRGWSTSRRSRQTPMRRHDSPLAVTHAASERPLRRFPSRPPPRSSANALVPPLRSSITHSYRETRNIVFLKPQPNRIVSAMKAMHSSIVIPMVPGYAQLQRDMHDALRTQHPEWLGADGKSPLCDFYESVFAQLFVSHREHARMHFDELLSISRTEHCHANSSITAGGERRRPKIVRSYGSSKPQIVIDGIPAKAKAV